MTQLAATMSEKYTENAYDDKIIPQKRLFSFLTSKEIPPLPSPDERKIYPESSANIISKIFFWWLNPIMRVGYKRTLQEEDLFVLPDEMTIQVQANRFHEKLAAQIERRPSVPNYTCALTLYKTFQSPFLLACLFMALSNIASTLNPLLTRHLITYVEERSYGRESNIGKGIGYAIGSALIVCFGGIAQNHCNQKAMMVGATCKSVLTKVIIEKSFRLSRLSRRQYPSGKITAMLGADIARIDICVGFLPVLLTFPIALAISIVILVVNIGVSALVGVALVLIFMVLLTYCSQLLMAIRGIANKFTDARINYIQEILYNMKIIKFYSWETPYYKRVLEQRKQEVKTVAKMQTIRNLLMAGSMSFTTISSMAAFLVLYALRGTNNAAGIFSSLSLFNILAQQVYVLPLVTANAADAYIAVTRINRFLCAEETVEEDIEVPELVENAIEIKNADFSWDYDEADEFGGLYDISLDVKQGELVIITGVIGSGKTSLLNAIAGIMPRQHGMLKMNGSCLFCGVPWIQNATVKENILFGLPFDFKKYHEVIKACSLEADLDMLPAGEDTEIGERGINISGGQKARICLARAVYADNDILLMDDVLSAVDAKVGRDIMNNCILGLLQKKTRVLATHQLSLIQSADKVVFINNGKIDVGTIEEISKRNQDFVSLMTHATTSEQKDETKESQKKEATKEVLDGKLMRKEDRATNSLGFNVYKSYMKLGSGIFTVWGWLAFYLLNTALATFCQLFSSTWLSFWVEKKFSISSGSYIGLYVMFCMLTVVFLVNELLSLVYLTNTAGYKLHNKSLKRILHTPMLFLDTTPLGRVMNRFSRDTEVLDNEIGNQLRIVSYSLSSIIGVLILCIVYLPWFAIAIPFLVFVFVAFASYYQASAREVKRLESTQRSFVYSTFGEILSGMETIKIYLMQLRFLNRVNYVVDKMNEAYFITITNQRWLGVHLTLVSSFFALIIALLCVTRVFNVSAASVGLLLSYVLQITQQMIQMMRSLTQVENQMNSVERLNQYAMYLEQEAPYKLGPLPENWPSKGQIQFNNVSVAYRKGLPLVLKNLNFSIKAGEKIGICGRTGAGKSSIMNTLFRINELSSGSIVIDDIDISKIGLEDLRSRLSIIPQDPILFVGSVRRNLDPFNQHEDLVLLDALRKAHLISANEKELMIREELQDHRFNLDHVVEENGDNYSLGEKQLLSLARALVRQTKILILDEATSSVDYETDGKIQTTIATEFRSQTILSIAHRLHTILSYDRVLVLDQGKVVEFDTPVNLYRAGKIFWEMCNKSNISGADIEAANR